MTTATIETEGPVIGEVYHSLLRILAKLSVAKNGTLPANMSGKPYLTAADVSKETKAFFVEEELILLPFEKETNKDAIINKDRINITVSIEGQYTIFSTKDGSSVTIQGVGDGLAGGTAVASNIASTNALKNALLRLFLITEQSVEDAAKNGPAEATEKQAPKTSSQGRAEQARQATPTATAGSELDTLKTAVRTWIGGDETKRNLINARMEALKADGKSGVDLQRALVAYTAEQSK
jgi:hypothetical protein